MAGVGGRLEARDEARHADSREARESSIVDIAPLRDDEAIALLGLDAYDEGDDAVTGFVEPPPSEPSWLVQVTPLDRRSMSSARLRSEWRPGGLVGRETLVWRLGMPNWSPLAHVMTDVGAAPGRASPIGLYPPVGSAAPAGRAASGRAAPLGSNDGALVLASSAASIGAVLLTLLGLAWAGVFEPGRYPSTRTLASRAASRVAPAASPAAARITAASSAEGSVRATAVTRPSGAPANR